MNITMLQYLEHSPQQTGNGPINIDNDSNSTINNKNENSKHILLSSSDASSSNSSIEAIEELFYRNSRLNFVRMLQRRLNDVDEPPPRPPLPRTQSNSSLSTDDHHFIDHQCDKCNQNRLSSPAIFNSNNVKFGYFVPVQSTQHIDRTHQRRSTSRSRQKRNER